MIGELFQSAAKELEVEIEGYLIPRLIYKPQAQKPAPVAVPAPSIAPR